MSRYDGLIIPRSYNEYINKTDPVAMLQALQQNNVMDDVPTSGSNHPAKSGGIFAAIAAATPEESVTKITITGHNNYMYLKKYGKVVNMALLGGWTNLPAGGSGLIGNIPEGYRPYVECRTTETSGVPIELQIFDDGTIEAHNYGAAITALRNGRFYTSWMTA